MSVIKVLRDLNGLFNYSTDENPTSQQDYQKAVKNWVKTIVNLVDSNLWQPETEYTVGSQLLTPSLPYYVLRCTVAGTSGAAEPDYTDVALGDEITDGTVTWVVDGYLPLSGGTLTGVVNGVTPTAGDNSKKLATTEFVNAKAGNYLPLSGGTMRGTITTTANPGLKVRDNDSYLVLCGASSYDQGAHMLLNGKNRPNYEGTFGIVANDGSGGYVILVGKPDGTLTWGNQPLLPVGVVQAFAGSTIPTGWLLCDGSAVSRTTYAKLYACIGTTYGSGDGSTTFNLPNLVDKFVEGSATAGTVKSAGLPNITGSFKACGTDYGGVDDCSGAFYARIRSKGGDVLALARSGYAGSGYGDFDASRSSAIYGKSDTVQPPALTMRYIIKY